MKKLPRHPDLVDVARHVIWFETAEQALENPARFLAYLMTYGTAEEIAVVLRHVESAAFIEALDGAPPGIFDPQSWAYWNIMADRYPTPPMPQRFDDLALVEIAKSRAHETGVPVDIDSL